MTGSSPSTPEDGDKSLTFRKRKLSLTNLREIGNKKSTPSPQNATFDLQAFQTKQNATVDLQVLQQQSQHSQSTTDNEEKAHSFRKRRLSLTHSREDSSHEDHESSQKRRRHSDASLSSLDSGGAAATAAAAAAVSQSNLKQQQLKSRIVHAPELLAHPPPSPMPASDNRLYEQSAPPQQKPLLDTGESGSPKWKKRHTRHMHEDERKLPFPRDIVGTFSCHGVEPIYDDDNDYEWCSPGQSQDNPDKLTTAAKINQDRGGVAFPYGNCAKTALFAVYDGMFEVRI